MQLAGLAPGSYTYTATFAGDTSYTGVTATGTIIVVASAQSTTLTLDPANPVTAPFSGSVVLKATLLTTAGAPVVGKYVTIKGAAQASSYGAYTDENGIASVSFSAVNPYNSLTLNGTAYSLSATWAGDSNYLASTSAPMTLTVVPGTATITFNAGTLSQTYTGTARTVTVSCITGLGAACTNQTVLSYSGINGTVYGPSTTAPINSGTYSVVATINNTSWYTQATATLTVGKATATLALVTADLTRTADGTSKVVRFTVTPTSLASSVTVTYTGIAPTVYGPSTTAPSDVGSYEVVATLTNANYTATSATGTMVINPGLIATTLTLGSLTMTYDGNPHAVSVTTDPAGQEANVTFLYTGSDVTYGPSANPPTNAGSYTVIATLSTPTHSGTATGLLVISPATATIELVAADLTQYADGAEKTIGFTRRAGYYHRCDGDLRRYRPDGVSAVDDRPDRGRLVYRRRLRDRPELHRDGCHRDAGPAAMATGVDVLRGIGSWIVPDHRRRVPRLRQYDLLRRSFGHRDGLDRSVLQSECIPLVYRLERTVDCGDRSNLRRLHLRIVEPRAGW